MEDDMHFFIHNHNHHHHHHRQDSSSVASEPSASAGVSPPSPSTSPTPFTLPLSPPHHFSPSPNPIPTNGPPIEHPRGNSRGRGRPCGSKNKPKDKYCSSPSPMAIPPPSQSMRTLLLQVNPDSDIIESLISFCRTRSVSLSVLSASGSLSQFVLRYPSSASSYFTLSGRFDILSIAATIVIDSSDSTQNQSPSCYFPSKFTVMVTSPHGQVLGGAIGGPLVAAGPVFILAACSRREHVSGQTR